jgi:hypothetical protein
VACGVVVATVARHPACDGTVRNRERAAQLHAAPVSACQTGEAAGVTTDQRGVTRPQGAGCDIGVEVAVPVAPTTLTAAFTG